MPLPPYIKRSRTPDRDTDAKDRDRYQTLFAEREGAVAAPTEAARQMSVDEIVHAVRVDVNQAVEAAKAQGKLVTVAPPPPVAAVSAAVDAGG